MLFRDLKFAEKYLPSFYFIILILKMSRRSYDNVLYVIVNCFELNTSIDYLETKMSI